MPPGSRAREVTPNRAAELGRLSGRTAIVGKLVKTRGKRLPVALSSSANALWVVWSVLATDRFQLTLAHDAALVRLIEALYLIFKLAVARRQSLDHYIRLVRHVQVNRVRGKQPLAELESVLRHNTDTLKWVN